MRVTTIFTLFFTTAIAAPAFLTGRTSDDAQLEKRLDPITLTVLTTVGSAASAWATSEALKQLKSLTSAASSWDSARETFTKAAVGDMMKMIGNDPSFKGAVCYNQGYTIDAAKRSDIMTLDFKSGPLKTDYDCFYLKSGAQFKGNGEGGFINMASSSVGNACPFDSNNIAITCN